MNMKAGLFLFSILGFISMQSEASDQDIDPADDERNIERPCPDFDVDCIRNYFWVNSQCQIALGPVPDPLVIDHYTLEIANSNLTAEMNHVKVYGLNGKIIEFYINHVTQKLVMATRMPSLKIYTPNIEVRYNRNTKEPIVRRDTAEYDYGAVTFTSVFPSIFNLDLNDAHVFSYIENSNPKFSIGPRVADTSDPTAQKEVVKFYASGVDNLLEGFITQGKIFMRKFIQYTICDFGSEWKECLQINK